MPRRLALALFLAVLGTASALTGAQRPDNQPPASDAAIRLRAGSFTPSRGEILPLPADQVSGPAAGVQPREYLVQFQGPVQETWKAAVTGAGATLLEYVPDFAFRVRSSPGQAAAIRQLPFVRWVGPFHAAYKMARLSFDATEIPVLVRLDRAARIDAIEAELAGTGIPVTRVGRSLLLVRARAAGMASLAQIEGVASVEPFLLRVKHNEFGGGVILGSRTANTNGFDGSSQVVGVADTGLGTGAAAGAHVDLPASRIRAIFNWPGLPNTCFDTIVNDGAADVDTGHGTHVATAVLGSGNALGVGRGTAPEAGLVFQAIENYAVPSLLCSLLYGVSEGYYLVGLPGDLGDLFQQAYDQGARLHTNSWGSAVNGAYTTDAENTDAFVWAHRDMTLLFSAGNQGVDADGDGQVDAGSIGSPATAKNVIAVGASENDRRGDWSCDTTLTYSACAAQGGQNNLSTYGATWPASYPANPLRDDATAGNAEQMAAFSSRGPTTDGRIKPDVVAPGTWTLSGYSTLFQQQYDASPNPQNGAYQYDGWGIPIDAAHKYMGGTSMAAPLAAGGAAVVRDFYQKAHAHAASAALVKATLINSAVDLLDENNDGALDNAFPIPNMHEGWGRVDLAAATDNTQQFSDEAAPLTTGATATYTFDVTEPGRPFKATLVWTDYPAAPTAAVSLVNDLDLTLVAPDGTVFLGNAFAGGWSTPGGTPDRVNNVENAYVPTAATGTWTVVVTGYNVPMGPQPFALVVDNGPAGTGSAVVRLSVDDASAAEAGLSPGAVRLTRTGDTTAPLTVHLAVAGTASEGTDFEPIPGVVVIPEGLADVTIPIRPIDDDQIEPVETVIVRVLDDSAYTTGSPSSGVVTLTSDDVPPDLVLSSLSAPSTAAAGGTLSVSVRTRNQGTAPSPASETGVYLSVNSTLDASDVLVGSRAVAALAGGASETGSAIVTIPADTPPGAYYLVGKADWADLVPETSESNNTRASATVRVGPDLLVTTLTVPSTGAPGGTLSLSDTTRNQGADGSDPSVTAFYLSANTSWDPSDTWIGSRSVAGLPAGAVSTAATVVTLPSTIATGTYYVLARADAGETIAESIETNNVRSATLRVGADLSVTALTAPATAAAGDVLTLSETTRNGGAADAPGAVTAFYLSTNASLDAADVRLGERAVPDLEASASSTATVALALPADTPAGTYYVVAKADAPGEIAETNEANNTRASGLIRVGPDLIVLSVTAPTTAGAGTTITVTESIRNQGGASSPATESALYLSSNTVFNAGDDIEIARRIVPILAASGTSSVSLSVTLPASVATGTYYVIAVVDPDAVVTESAENNNTRASGTMKVGPDLTIASLTGPGSALRGATVTLTDTTRNQGSGGAASSTTRFYLSTNATLDAADVAIGARPVAPLGATLVNQGSTPVTIPAGTTPGVYYIIARADDSDSVVETAENNNVRTLVFRVDP